MVRQSTIRVENGQVSSTNIAHAQLLVTRSAGRVCKLLKVTLEKNNWCKRIDIVDQHTSFSDFSLFNASMACISFIDSSTFPCSPAQSQYSPILMNRLKRRTQCLNLFRSTLNCKLNFSNFTHLSSGDASASNRNMRTWRDTDQVSGLRVFLWGLFQPPLRCPNTAITLIYEDKNVVLVFCLEFGKNWVAGVLLSGCKEFCLQPFGM
jgi:hypothetical protein